MTLEHQKSELFLLLQKAMELELSTIPPYMTTLLSIKREANREAANSIRSVMIEEMLHMVLVGNLISSLGGKVSLGKDAIPSYPLRMEFDGKAFADREFTVDLARFSPATIDVFLKIELPTELAGEKNKPMLGQSEIDIPGITIGAFYARIIAMLETLCAAYPEADVFCGDPSLQVNEDYYWSAGGKPIRITNLATARQALTIITSQGEGAGNSIDDDDATYFNQPEEVAHYFRFNEIALGRHYRPGDTPRDPPSGAPIDIDYAAVYPIKTNARQADYAEGSALAKLNEAFNRKYSLMLTQIEKAFNGHPAALYDAIVSGMHSLAPMAQEMMALPISANDPRTHGAPSFEWVDLP